MSDSNLPTPKKMSPRLLGCHAVILTLILVAGGAVLLAGKFAPGVGYQPPPAVTNPPQPTRTPRITPTASPADKLVDEADEAWKVWNVEKALDLYNRALDLDPKNELAYVGRALTYHRMDMDDKAQADLDAAEQIDSEVIEIWLARGDIAIDQLDNESIEFYDRALSINMDDVRVWVGFGTIYHLSHKSDEALGRLSHAEVLDPEYADTYNVRGLVYYQSDEYQDYGLAREEFERAVELDPTNPIFILNLANANKHLSEFDEAEKLYQQAIQVAPTYAGAYETQARYFFDRDMFAPAVESYSHAIDAKWGVNDAIYYWRGLSHALLQEYEPAIADFGIAIDYSPSACLLNNRCSAHIGLGSFQEAVDDCTAALDMGTRVDTYFNRARAYDGLGMSKEALADYQIYVQYADPTSNAAIYAQERIKTLGVDQGAVCATSVSVSMCTVKAKPFSSVSQQDDAPLLYCND